MELYTIIAQIINFGVLVFLLNRFLFKPVMRTIEKRKQDIKDIIEETQKKLEESDRLKEEYFNKLKEVEDENIVLRRKAVEDVKKFKETELQKAKDDVSVKKNKFDDYLKLEQKNLIENFNENLLDLFNIYSSDLLGVIANSSLQEQLLNKFLDKINGLSNVRIEEINNLKSDTIKISSNAELSKEGKLKLVETLKKKNFIFDDVEFDIDKKLIIGIELKVGSYVLSWNTRELTTNFVEGVNKKLNTGE